jgi:hypothetical protein
MMTNLFKEKCIQILSLLLLIISYFLPWFNASTDENYSLYKDFKLLWKLLLSENDFRLFSSWEYGVWDTITLGLLHILVICSVLLPILSGITIYRIYRNRKYKIYKNITLIFAIGLIVTYFNYYLYGLYWEWEPSLEQGLFIALIALIVLAKSSTISRKIDDLISKNSVVNEECTNCKKQVEKGEKYCSNCNVVEEPTSIHSHQEMNYCSYCGNKIGDNANFCMNCGKKITGNDRSINSISFFENLFTKFPNVKSKTQRLHLNNLKSRKGLAIIGIIIVAIIILLGKQSPSDVAKKFIKATQAENYDKAEKLWSDSGKDYMLRQLGDERWIYQTMRNFTHRTDGDVLEDFQITQEEKAENDMIHIYATFIFSSGKHSDAQLAMVKEDGKWKIFAFTSD